MAEIERRQVYEVKLAFEVVLGEENVAINLLQSRAVRLRRRLALRAHVGRAPALQAVHYLKIRIDLMRREGNAICTSQLCRWNQPKKAPKRDLALISRCVPSRSSTASKQTPRTRAAPRLEGALRGGAGGG